jgi:acid stress-induced BolA-like protein IbaG/YrbA
VSDSFKDIPLLKRHRTINSTLAAFLGNGGVRSRPNFPALISPRSMLSQVHALAISALTSQQWIERGGVTASSPACMGGMKAEQRAAEGRQQQQQQQGSDGNASR